MWKVLAVTDHVLPPPCELRRRARAEHFRVAEGWRGSATRADRSQPGGSAAHTRPSPAPAPPLLPLLPVPTPQTGPSVTFAARSRPSPVQPPAPPPRARAPCRVAPVGLPGRRSLPVCLPVWPPLTPRVPHRRRAVTAPRAPPLLPQPSWQVLGLQSLPSTLSLMAQSTLLLRPRVTAMAPRPPGTVTLMGTGSLRLSLQTCCPRSLRGATGPPVTSVPPSLESRLANITGKAPGLLARGATALLPVTASAFLREEP